MAAGSRTGLRLAPLAEVGAEELARELNDIEISRWLTATPFPYTLADAEAFKERAGADQQVKAILAPEGFAGLVDARGMLSYWVSRRFWGRGYGPEAARRMVARHFLTRSALTLEACYCEGNARSEKMLFDLGFAPNGVETVVPRSTGEQVPLYKVLLERERFWESIGMPIRTPQLILRPMWPEDARALTRIVTQEAVAKMLFLFNADWDDADAFIDTWAYVGDLHFRLAIVHEGKFIGTIGVGEGREPTTFYFLDPAIAGKGVATEAVAAFTDFLFQRFDIDALTPDVFVDNPASMRVLEKCGYKAVGRGMAKSAARLEPAPIVHYRLDRKDHAAR